MSYIGFCEPPPFEKRSSDNLNLPPVIGNQLIRFEKRRFDYPFLFSQGVVIVFKPIASDSKRTPLHDQCIRSASCGSQIFQRSGWRQFLVSEACRRSCQTSDYVSQPQEYVAIREMSSPSRFHFKVRWPWVVKVVRWTGPQTRPMLVRYDVDEW